LLGHIDTVPGEIQVHVEDGWLYGRGSVDAKGPLCAFAEATAQAQLSSDWRVLVVGAVEEEAPTSRGAHFVRDQYQPDLCIIGEPSGADRITLGYKGHLMLDYSLARPVAHSSRPEPTVAELGVAFWTQVEAWARQKNQAADRQFDKVMPHLRAIHTHSDGFQDVVEMTLSFRLPPRCTVQDVVAAVSTYAEQDSRLRAYSAVEAYRGEKNNALVRGMLAAIRAQGERPGFVVKGGTSDMNVVGEVWKCPIIAYGPGDSNLDHTPEERLQLSEYRQAVNTLRHIIEHLPGSQ
jgi:LysW-gamma-L-lysine carboxypeptidase